MNDVDEVVMMHDISSVIQKASLAGALTEGAITTFNKLIHDKKTAVEEVLQLTEQSDGRFTTVQRLTTECAQLQTALNAWEERGTELADREKEITKLEMKAENESRRVNDHIAMVGLIFRNTKLREGVVSQALHESHSDGSYSSSDPVVSQVEKEEV